ncbi:type 3 dihydrofolate reductase [Buchnera aphidicola]|uniref:Dihydrofolate reductase n=1 Tax=Buchnera aphidicola str. USDA (Myzus persicae) TaxID=1009856 RepID=W0P475_BUCMP|nr:type 3 dihydrofolate reductase [Buchnera aphidicola]AHG60227.1 Fola [Buchnera aphidicola str. USDA (Myzus persicae)]AHG60805.1 Fola [Buchnera aphidicola str. W106 (Myzus persicae)]AHG61377.1 Fola [Buchnera aphidicola str. G002 (Myzus persicae)]AHG61950.1 Fola [Buchnera aphidicola str. F009 (Myzus persicae)]WAI03084.1 MAG: type 3 dihydrofolate reductase [Buchnera aphidicola (Myzus persicae)]
MNISLIAAISKNFVIGHNNKIPWHLPEDLKWFKKNTINKNVIMGRLTWESIRKPLSMRNNIVISKKKIDEKGIIWADSISNAILAATKYNQEIMVIGGAQVYKKMLFYAKKLYLTHIDINVNGDTYFPKYQLYPYWKIIFRKNFIKNTINPYNYCFEILYR